MNSRSKKFISYYRPHLGLFFADLACAFIVAGTTLALPLGASYITNLLQAGTTPDTLNQIYLMGAILLVLLVVHTGGSMFVDYRGHSMGALMEGDMRRELFEHFQQLSFSFYDEQRTGQLMTRITNDVFWLSELFHHGPEDFAIAVIKFAGVLVILLSLNVQLSVILLLFLPVMGVYAFYFNKRMNAALRITKDRIGDINAQVEDSLAGIRVVKSFTNEAIEEQKFAYANRPLRREPVRRLQKRNALFERDGRLHPTDHDHDCHPRQRGDRPRDAQFGRVDDVSALRRHPDRADPAVGQYRPAVSGRDHRVQPLHGDSGSRAGDQGLAQRDRTGAGREATSSSAT